MEDLIGAWEKVQAESEEDGDVSRAFA